MSEIANLERLIAKIDGIIAGLPERDRTYDHAQWRAWRAAVDEGFERLLREEGGRTRPYTGDTVHLRLVGVSTSCTSGRYGAMRNWQAAARRRIEKLREKARDA